MIRRAAALASATTFVVFSIAASARAEGARSRVAVVRMPSSDPLLLEASTRLHAELVNAGFEVVDVEPKPGDGRIEVEDAAAATKSFAAVAIDRAGTGALADVWIGDEVTDKTVVKRLRVGGGANAATVLAIRALELLRASLLEVAAPSKRIRAPEQAPADVVSWVEPTLPRKEPAERTLLDGPALGIGAIALRGTRGLGPALGPTVGGSLGLPGGAFGRLAIAAPLVGGNLSATGGSATVRQEFAALDFGWATKPEPLAAFGWVGIGMFHLHTAGAATPPFHSTSDDVYSFLVSAGVGGLARVGSRLGITAEILAVGLEPKPVVVIVHHDAGTAGGPSLGLSLGLLVGL